jgi:hypothetical protein
MTHACDRSGDRGGIIARSWETTRGVAMDTTQSRQSMHRFILQAIDPNLGCPVLETMLALPDLDRLRSLLGEAAADDPELRGAYQLASGQLHAITETFGVAFDPDGRECWLGRARSIETVPYLVHTGYELALMLDGVKPFAKFIIDYPVEPENFSEHALFEPRSWRSIARSPHQ